MAQTFIIGEDFIGQDSVCLVLGDNIFYGEGFSAKLIDVASSISGVTVFGYQVKDLGRFGVVEFDNKMSVKSIEEKPSLRGELEITCINNAFLEMNELKVELLGREFAWLDSGTHDSLLDASSFVATIEKRQGYKIAWRNSCLKSEELNDLAVSYEKNSYGEYLKGLLD